MTNYDHIESAKKIAELLQKENLESDAIKISECIHYSSTGGEIVMCCRYNFLEILKEKKINAKALIKEINQYLDNTK